MYYWLIGIDRDVLVDRNGIDRDVLVDRNWSRCIGWSELIWEPTRNRMDLICARHRHYRKVCTGDDLTTTCFPVILEKQNETWPKDTLLWSSAQQYNDTSGWCSLGCRRLCLVYFIPSTLFENPKSTLPKTHRLTTRMRFIHTCTTKQSCNIRLDCVTSSFQI